MQPKRQEFSESLALDIANGFHEAWRSFRYRETTEEPELREFLQRIPEQFRNTEIEELLGIEFYHRFRSSPPDPSVRAEYERKLPDYLNQVQKTWLAYFGPEADSTTTVTEESRTDADHFERYRILQEIGEGGFGTVYMAQQHEPVRRKVALKVIKRGMDTKSVIARFDAERQALAILDHPHIAKILDGGATRDGRPYFVMELVNGVSITTYCDDNRLSISGRLKLFVDICEAVQHAHQKGIIHRDLKPSNVLVTLHDGKPIVKVIDFGVAKAMGRELTAQTMFTAFGEMIGTPQYMSPEQAERSGLDIDTRSDVYSLGVMLYELLTGTTPLEKEALRQAGYAGIQKLVVETESPRPSQRLSTLGERLTHVATSRRTDPDQLSREVRGDLDSIILKALEKERARRYETASSLAADVERFLRGDEVLAMPPTTIYRLRKFARRHRSLVTMVATVGVILVAATGFSVWQAVVADKERAIARDAESQANELQEQAQASAESERAARLETEEARDSIEKLLYVSDMNVVRQLWEQGKVARVRELLMRHKPEEGGEDYRGFEWYYYLRLASKTGTIPAISLDDDVTTVAVAPLRSLLVVATRTETRFYSSVPPYRLLHAYHPHGKEVEKKLEVAVSPDGTRLVTITGPELKLWNIEELGSPKLVGPKLTPPEFFRSVAFSSDGTQFAVGQHKILTIYSSDFIELKKADLKFDANVLAFSGNTLAVADYDDTRIWLFRDVLGEDDPIVLEGHTANVTSLSISQDGDILASTNHDSMVKLWDTTSGTELATMLGHRGASWSSAFSPTGNVLATVGIDMQVRVWDLGTYRQVAAYRGHRFETPWFQAWNQLKLMSYSTDGATLFSAAADRQIKPWKVDEMAQFEVQTLDGYGEWTDAISFAPDGEYFVTRARKEDLILWDTRSGNEIDRIPGNEPIGWPVIFSPDGRTLAIPQGEPRGVELRDLTAERTRTIPGNSVSFSPKGNQLAIGGSDGLLVLDWDDASGHHSGSHVLHQPGGKRFSFRHTFSPDGRLFAYSSPPDIINLCDAEDFAIKWRGEAGGSFSVINELAFSADSRTLFLLNGRTVQVWDVETGKLVEELTHPFLLWKMAVSPDGKTLATASHDGSVVLWSLALRQVVANFQAHEGSAVGVAFSPDGKTLASCGSDGKIRLWRAATNDEVRW